MGWEFEISRCILLHLEWLSNEVLLYSTGNYTQSLGTDQYGGEERNVSICKTGVTLLDSRIWYNVINHLHFKNVKKKKKIKAILHFLLL